LIRIIAAVQQYFLLHCSYNITIGLKSKRN
jgi:hypothetical protein